MKPNNIAQHHVRLCAHIVPLMASIRVAGLLHGQPTSRSSRPWTTCPGLLCIWLLAKSIMLSRRSHQGMQGRSPMGGTKALGLTAQIGKTLCVFHTNLHSLGYSRPLLAHAHKTCAHLPTTGCLVKSQAQKAGNAACRWERSHHMRILFNGRTMMQAYVGTCTTVRRSDSRWRIRHGAPCTAEAQRCCTI